MSIAYYNGDFAKLTEIRIPLSDRAVFFGDGIYDAAIGRDGYIYLEKEHLERFYSNAKRLNIPVILTRDELSSLLHTLIEKNGYEYYFIYFQLTRRSDERIHAYPDSSASNLLITVKRHTLPSPDRALSLISSPDIRYRMCDIKTLNLLPAVIASKKAVENGCDEAVFVKDGTVTECAHSNISIVKGDTVYTHPNGPFILPGITRTRMLYICKELKIQYAEKPFSYEEMLLSDEILITSTTKLCLRANKIDGKCVGGCKKAIGNELIAALREDFMNYKKRQNSNSLKF